MSDNPVNIVTLSLLRAQNIGSQSPPVLRVEIEEQIQDIRTFDEARANYADEAQRLSDALYDSLPGGTLDALLCEMMRRKSSLFVVPIDGRSPTQNTE